MVGDSAAKPLELNPVIESQFVIVNAPVNLDEFPLETQSVLPPRLRRDVGKTSIGATATDVAATNAPPEKPTPPAPSEPLWNLPVDTPESAPEPIAEDLNFPLAEPTFAGLDGPFILGPWKAVEPPKSRRAIERASRTEIRNAANRFAHRRDYGRLQRPAGFGVPTTAEPGRKAPDHSGANER